MDVISKGYNEYKYIVKPNDLEGLIYSLDAIAKNSDPYPEGTVESCYYDSLSMDCLENCSNGNSIKIKFRTRRYNENLQSQLQIKSKSQFRIGKLNSSLPAWKIFPSWLEACENAFGGDTQKIKYFSLSHPPLFPIINVRYRRNRYRFFGFRVNVDYSIEAFPYAGLRSVKRSFISLPCSVLEVKTQYPTPILPPIMNAMVTYGSFSKFANLTNALLGVD